jgi:hypothetical protein
MKGALDRDTFVDRCRHISGSAKCPTAWTIEHARKPMREYRAAIEAGGGTFALTKHDFNTITAQPCTFCHRTTRSMGINRNPPRVPYDKENTRAC